MITEIIAKCITTTLLAYFVAKTLKHEKNLSFIIIFTGLSMVANIISQRMFPTIPPLSMAITTLVSLIIIIVLIKNKLYKKIIVYGLTYIIGALSEVFMYVGWSLVTGDNISFSKFYDPENTIIMLIFIIVWLFIAGILYYITYIMWNKIVEKDTEKKISYFVLFPSNQSSLILFTIAFAIQNNASVNTYGWILFLAVFSVIADVIIYKVIADINRKRLLEQQNVILEETIISQEKYYDAIVADINKTNKIRHDIKNQLQTVYALIENESTNEAKKQLHQLENIVNDDVWVCQNKVVASVVRSKQKICNDKKIVLNFDINIPEKISIKEIDLCSVFANILDNAINASKENDVITISATINKGYLVIKSENKISNRKNKNETSSSFPRHGLGLLIIEDIKEKYNGDMQIEQTKSDYKITLFLQTN